MSGYLKRLAMPKTWRIKRKGTVFITRPNPGPHSMGLSMPLNLIIRDILGYAENKREVRKVLMNNNVMVDGVRRKDHKLPVGLMDTIEIKETGNCYRVILSKKGNIELIAIDKKESNLKPCKITGKSKAKGKTQLNLYDGRNILVEKDDYKVGDSLLIKVPEQNIEKHFKFANGALIYLTGGKHIGEFGTVAGIKGNDVSYKNKSGEVIETLKKYAFVVGEGNTAVKLEK